MDPHGLTQVKVAQQVGVSQAHISAIERGRSLDWVTINKLSQIYDIPQHALAARALGIRSEVEDAIEVAAELNADDRSLLLAMYKFMQARGPLADAGAA